MSTPRHPLVEREIAFLKASRRRQPAALLAEGTALMKDAYPDRLKPAQVIAVLDKAGVGHTLIGAHALGTHTKQPRATKDVDVVVSNVDVAAAAIRKAYPKFQVVDMGEAGKRVVDAEGAEVVDLLRPIGLVRRHALQHHSPVKSGKTTINVGSLPLMIALKWVGANSISRPSTKRAQDNVDLRNMVAANLGHVPAQAAAALIVKGNPLMGAKFLMDIKAIENELEDELE